jgi:hypothetical protein
MELKYISNFFIFEKEAIYPSIHPSIHPTGFYDGCIELILRYFSINDVK